MGITKQRQIGAEAAGIRTLAGLLVTLLAFACNQEPSFQEEVDSTRRSSDQTAAGDSTGIPPGEDPIDGDIEPIGEDAGTDGGDTDGVDGGDADGGDADGGTDSDGDGDSDGGTDGQPQLPKRLKREMTFPSHLLMDSSVMKDLDQPFLTQDLTLMRTYTDKSRQQTQVVRPVLIDSFDQGHSGAVNTEQFNQVANRPLDILIVVDNSGSMEEEQRNLSSKLAPLLSYIADTDWQIGIVTTDPNQNCLRKLVKKGDTNAAANFASGVTAGISGSGNERGILMAVRSLSGTCLSQPWIRSDSTLATLFVGDEDNCSDGTECPGKDYASGDYLYNYLASIREPGKNARVYGIIWHPSQTKDQCPTGYNQGKIFANLIDRTQGTWGSICDADYSATLSQISQNIQAVLNSKFTLRYQPEPGSLRVFLDATEITTGFTMSGKVVDINPPPADGVKVTFTYRYGAQPIKTTFALRNKPMADRVAVTFDGVAVDPSLYTLNLATPSIVFQAPPPERAKVVVTYTRDVPLTTQYLLVDNVKPGTMTIFINNVETTDYTINEALGIVNFPTPPPEGATIKFDYTSVGAPILKYPFTAPYGTPKDLVAYDTQTSAPVRVSYASNFVNVNADDYVEGRNVTLRYDNVARQKFDVALPNEPVPGTVAAIGGNLTCTSAQDLKIQGMVVSVDDCGFADDVTQVLVQYRYVVQAYQEFTFAADKLPAPGEFQEWNVWVNDQKRTDFTRDGNVIRFAAPLPAVSVVKIQLIQADK